MHSGNKIKQKILLLGGYYGSGKSTLGQGLLQNYGFGINLDYDAIASSMGVFTPDTFTSEARKEVGAIAHPNALIAAVEAGESIIVVETSFAKRERRDLFLQILQRYEGSVEVYPIMMMLPMKETIARIQRDRRHQEHPINAETVLKHYREANKLFGQADNSDLLLPTDVSQLAPEWRSLLVMSIRSHSQTTSHPQWVVSPHNLTVSLLMEILSDSPDASVIQSHIEGHVKFQENFIVESVGRSKEIGI